MVPRRAECTRATPCFFSSALRLPSVGLDAAIAAQQQANCDAFNALGLVPRAIRAGDAVWTPAS